MLLFISCCLLAVAIATNMSVRPSVCHTRESRLTISRYRNMLCTIPQSCVSSFLRPNFAMIVGIHPEREALTPFMLCRQRKDDQYCAISRKRREIGCELVSFTNREPHTGSMDQYALPALPGTAANHFYSEKHRTGKVK